MPRQSSYRRSILKATASLFLLLVPVSVSAQKAAADYFVRSLPGEPEDTTIRMHAGHIEVDQATNGNLFFWHVTNRHIEARQRTVIWLNGGPGCSSMDGALMEVGPYRVKDGKLSHNEGSWHEFANLLFVDNPVGTGFSYVNGNGFLHELPEMAKHFVIFLEKFFEIFPHYEKDEIWFGGESYAGQYIPYIAKAIVERNRVNPRKWNLAGLLIGNGWIDPKSQYPAYLEYAYSAGLVKRESNVATRLEAQQATCLAHLQQFGNQIEDTSCEEILQLILRLSIDDEKDGRKQCYNMYDVRLKETYPSCGMAWPPDLKWVTPYLRQPDVVKALHVNSDKMSGWEECSGAVSGSFRARNSKSSVELLPDLLKDMKIMLFSGDQDLICNHIGTENLIKNMTWNGATGFETSPGVWAPRSEWVYEGNPAGYYQTARNLTYVLVYNSSHMVPFDVPMQSLDMLDRFIGVSKDGLGHIPMKPSGKQSSSAGSGSIPANATLSDEEEKAEQEKLEKERWKAYYRSGEIVLVIVIVAAGVWGYWVWRQRRAMADGHTNGIAYTGLSQGKRSRRGDIEDGDFEESELDDLHVASPVFDREAAGEGRYSIGGDSDDSSGETRKRYEK
ncbi:Cell death protease [Arthrobotrys musiformis]|uniref:Pheromone-processing carboxypeptidase KEX1 n=1 Tax=Arthrobotrys musiformis TaxID=47236 RepID=A0AAV9VZ78_9PEZI